MADEKNTPSTPPAPKASVAAAAPKPAPAPSAPAAEKPQASSAAQSGDDITISPERPAVVDMRFVIDTVVSIPEVALNTFLKTIKRVVS
ncbi:MAG: hypothetical protein HGB11_09065 [Chlorobiales bacterium]|nr:hypothetical protein [Chlorobiales bacterium]